jgi:hypothetical protein
MTITAAGSQSQLLRIAETTWGTTPATPTGIFTRFTGVTLNPERSSFDSKEIRSDRQTADVRMGILTGAGDLDFELSAGAFDDLFEACLGGTWATDVLKIGSTRKSFTMEMGHPDIGAYQKHLGVLVDKFSLSFVPEGIVTGKFSLISKSVAAGATSAFGTTTAAPTDSPMDSFSGTIKLAGAVVANITKADLALDNGIETAKVLGQNSLADAVLGRASVSGTLTALFQDQTMLNMFLNETETSLELKAAFGTKSYILDMARIKFSGAKGGITKEGLISYDMPFMALAPTTGTDTTLKITRDLV